MGFLPLGGIAGPVITAVIFFCLPSKSVPWAGALLTPSLLVLPLSPVGVFFSTGELWRTTRRFTMSAMRNLGMGKQLMEEHIFEELHFLTEMIKSHQGEPGSKKVRHRITHIWKGPLLGADTDALGVPITGEPFSLRSFNIAPTNITFHMVFGERFDYQDPTFLSLLRLIDEVMVLLGSPYLHVSSPAHVFDIFVPGKLLHSWIILFPWCLGPFCIVLTL